MCTVLLPQGDTPIAVNKYIISLITFRKSARKFKFHENLTMIMGIFHEDHGTFPIISRSDLLRMRNASGKTYRQNKNTKFKFNNFIIIIIIILFFPPKFAPFMR